MEDLKTITIHFLFSIFPLFGAGRRVEDRKGGYTNTGRSTAHLGLRDGNDNQSSVCGKRVSVKEKSKMGQKEVVKDRNERFYNHSNSNPTSKYKGAQATPKV